MDFKLFLPGQFLNVEKRYSGNHLVKNATCVSFPGRIQMCPLNFNEFEFGKAGGGGFGVSVRLNNTIKISKSDNDKIICDAKREPLIRHYLLLMKEIFGASEGFSIDLSLDPLMGDHFGLGSTSMISCAIVFGMNDMFGGVLSKRECVDIVCNNYVEVYQGKVTAGLATGVSIHTAFNGGFVIVGSNAKLAYKSKVPKEYKIVLIKTGAKRLDMDKPENLSQLEDSKRLDQDYKYIRAYNFLMNIIPSLMQGDWDSLSSSNDCQLCGGQKGVVESYENNGEAIKNIFKKLESVPGATFGVTSVGPSVFVFTKRYEEVEALCKGIGVDFEVLDINNVGLSVSKN